MSWTLDRVDVDHVASTLLPDPEVDALVDSTWARQVATATARGQRLSDAPAYRLETYAGTGDRLRLGLALVDYRRHSAMKEIHHRVAPEHHDRVLVVDAVVTTSDDQVVLLRTEKPTGTELQLVGGTATPGQREIHSAEDLAVFAVDRISRALPGCGEVHVGAVLGVFDQEIGCRNLVLAVRLSVPAASLVGAPGNELVVLPATGLRDFLLAAPAYLPAVATLL